MSDVFFTYRNNLFNNFVGHRVKVTIRNRRKREKVFIGTFKAYDLDVNIVLADVYRVILNVTEEQRQDVDGLLLIRGINVRSVRFQDHERRLPTWPTKPRKAETKTEKSPARSQESRPKAPSTPSTPSKPVKLIRSWLTTTRPGSVNPSPTTTTSLGSPTNPLPITVKKEPPEVKQEVVIKEEIYVTTFDDFLLNSSDYEDLKEVKVKTEVPASPGSDMSTSS